MQAKRRTRLLKTLTSIFGRRRTLPPELQAGKDVVAAIDAGGVPLNPVRINQIARNLGLEVAASAPVEQTIERLRAAVERGMQAPDAQAAANENKHIRGRK
ncbi:MAG: hypothetical protein FD157_3575 [Rhodocyclaceae bacterium]|nr:MAG: hypothetical protein FD157_3575 [Rhodocyclaceae bacterium]TND00617.1 MAG: hypothetical protein FD118_2987 [Rhodocyclaceae bacterium]